MLVEQPQIFRCVECYEDKVTLFEGCWSSHYKCSGCLAINSQLEGKTAKDGELRCDHCGHELDEDRREHPCSCPTGNPPCHNCTDHPWRCPNCSTHYSSELEDLDEDVL